MMAGTPCPYKGKIGQDAQKAWEENHQAIPTEATTIVVKAINEEEVEEEKNNYNSDSDCYDTGEGC